LNHDRHLDDWTLEQLAGGTLSDAERPGAAEHIRACELCAGELAGHRALQAALSGLPRFAPSAGFNDAVMARVRVPQPSPVWSMIQRRAPRTRRGWAMLSGALAAPALPLVWLAVWVYTQPGISIASLWRDGTERAGSLAWALLERTFEWGLGTGVFGWARAIVNAALDVPLETAAGAFGVLAVAIPLSAWSLFRLVRTPMGNGTYAN
jgi:anti-sigma factor RsiW